MLSSLRPQPQYTSNLIDRVHNHLQLIASRCPQQIAISAPCGLSLSVLSCDESKGGIRIYCDDIRIHEISFSCAHRTGWNRRYFSSFAQMPDCHTTLHVAYCVGFERDVVSDGSRIECMELDLCHELRLCSTCCCPRRASEVSADKYGVRGEGG